MSEKKSLDERETNLIIQLRKQLYESTDQAEAYRAANMLLSTHLDHISSTFELILDQLGKIRCRLEEIIDAMPQAGKGI